MNGFVIGNGESRLGFDLTQLDGKGTLYGCNALYRDFSPDVLVSVDRKMLEEVRNSSYNGEFICRNRFEGFLESSHGKIWKNKGWASGPTATWLLCERSVVLENVFLIGFDFVSKTEKLNNVYKDTKCYRASRVKAVNPNKWVKQFRVIFIQTPRVRFYRVMPNLNEYKLKDFDDIENFKNITFKEMFSLIGGK